MPLTASIISALRIFNLARVAMFVVAICIIVPTSALAKEATLTQSLELIAEAASESNWAHAAEIAKRSKDPVFATQAVAALKIFYTPEKFTPAELNNFFTKASWVPLDAFRSRIEKSLDYNTDRSQLRQWYLYNKASSQFGKLISAYSLSESPPSAENLTDIKSNWLRTKLDYEGDSFFLKFLATKLTAKDILQKVEFYIWNNEFDKAKRLISHLPSDLAGTAEEQLLLAKKPEMLKRILAKSASYDAASELTKYLAIKYLLDNSHEQHAINLLKNTKSKIHNEKWFNLRNRLARECLSAGNFQDSYRIISEHGLVEGNDFVEAEFLAGWIALRFLNEPNTALKHFINMLNNSSYSSSKAKAHYWLYKSYQSLGKTEKERYHLEQGAEFKGNFYGILSLADLKGGQKISYFEKEASSFEEDDSDSVKKLTLFVSATRKAKIEPLSRNLIDSIADANTDSRTIKTALDFLKSRSLNSLAVELSTKATLKRGFAFEQGFPNKLPVDDDNLENKELYLAIIRQESFFNQEAASDRGARGLMQLMPDTAALMAKKLGLPKNGYITSSAHNFMKGSAYIDSLISNFGGSKILAISSYNAGPGNVKKWLEKYGDPRGKTIDFVIDWLELIPFSQTRLYNKKVLENYIIYQCLEQHQIEANKILEVLSND